MAYKNQKRKQSDIAKERILMLFEKAENVFGKSQRLASRYVTLAVKISHRTNTRIPASLQRKFCKNCLSFLVPGVNCRVRTKGKLVYTCLGCGKSSRMPYLRKLPSKKE